MALPSGDNYFASSFRSLNNRRNQGRPRCFEVGLCFTMNEVTAEIMLDQDLQSVGRPGLDPGTLGLKGSFSCFVVLRSSPNVCVSKGFVSLLDEQVSWCCSKMRPEMRPVVPCPFDRMRSLKFMGTCFWSCTILKPNSTTPSRVVSDSWNWPRMSSTNSKGLWEALCAARRW